MTRYFLAGIEIEGFRGINNDGEPLELKFKTDQVNSIFAANGLGKSSIFEALCYALQDGIPKLDNLPDTEQANQYYCNRFHSTGQAVITLRLQPDDGAAELQIRVMRSRNGRRTVDSPTGHADPHKVLASLAGEMTLLDHATFIRFIEDTPLERGRSFSALLGLAKLSEFRQVLQTLSNKRTLTADFDIQTIKNNVEAALLQVRQHEAAIRSAYRNLLGVDVSEPIDATVVAGKICESLTAVPLLSGFCHGKELKDIAFAEIEEAIANAEGGERRIRYATVLKWISELELLTANEVERAELAEQREMVATRDAALRQTRGPLFQKLYAAAHAIFELDEWENDCVCPTCDHEHQVSIADRIDERLGQFAQVVETQDLIRQKWPHLTWPKRLQAIENHEALAITSDDRKFAQFDSTFRTGEPSSQTLTDAQTALDGLEAKRVESILALTNEKTVLEAELPPSLVTLAKQVEYAKQLQNSIKARELQQIAHSNAKSRLDIRQSWESFIVYASKAFADAEVALSTAQATAIESQYRAYYDRIAGNPQIVPALKKSATTEELHLRLEKFYSLENVSAATLLPESCRNALAISIFLSTALRSAAPARFIVLDDVTSSFDAGHQWQFMELLRTEISNNANPNGPQVILLSHDGLLEKYFDTMASNAVWNHQRLQGLPPLGTLTSSRQSRNRLRDNATRFLNGGQTRDAEPLVRQYLEFRLLEVIRAVGVPVPLDFSIRDDRKMVRNCLDVIEAAVTLHQQAGRLVLSATQLADLQNVHIPAIVSNWLAHYPTSVGASLTPYVYLGVLDSIDRIADCFRYQCVCGGTPQPRYYKNLSEKACTC